MSDRPAASLAQGLNLEVARGRLQAIVDEAGAVIVRTAFSQVVRDGKDFACALLTPAGDTIVQATGVPVFLGTTTTTARALLERVPADQIRPGAVIGTNDVWLGTGHLYDVTLVVPVFVDEQLIALSSVVVHLPDIGGRGWGSEARQVFEEGFQIPPMRLGTTAAFDPMLIRLLRANVRLPDEAAGDLEAALNAAVTIARQAEALARSMSPAGLAAVASELERRSEKFMRDRILALPDGAYSSRFESMAVQGAPFRIELTITISGDEMEIDFEGSSPQVDAGINCCLAYTRAYVIYAIKCLLAPDLPLNEGAIRPIRVLAPEASVVNSRFPAAGTARNLVGMHVPTMIIHALAGVLPESGIADCGSPPPIGRLHGQDGSGDLFSILLSLPGGFGARFSSDGPSCLCFPANMEMIGVETTEAESPILFTEQELIPDSGGAGRHRGGLGLRTSVTPLAPPLLASFLVERLDDPPQGVARGSAGAPTRLLKNGLPVANPSATIELGEGDVLTIDSPGGGGFGDPALREAAELARDVRGGYVSPSSAAPSRLRR